MTTAGTTARAAAGVIPQQRDRAVAPDVPRALGGRGVDEIASLAGSALAALALVWVVYENVLAMSGTLGFIAAWFATFLVFYLALSLLANPLPVALDRLATAVIAGAAMVVGFALATTVVYTFAKGWHAVVEPNFFTHDMKGVRPTSPIDQGGILHAVIGSGIEVGIAVLISLPLGIGTGVYLTEVGGRGSRFVRTVIEAMTALPDILAGLFVYVTLIVAFGFERSGLAAALALAITMLPIIARASEVQLRVVPGGLREAGLALGASQWSTVWRVVLPTAKSGLATALILGVARAVGETAPVLIASASSTFVNKDPVHGPMNSLPLFIFSAVRSGQPTYITRGFGAAAVLLSLVLVLFALIRFLARDRGSRR